MHCTVQRGKPFKAISGEREKVGVTARGRIMVLSLMEKWERRSVTSIGTVSLSEQKGQKVSLIKVTAVPGSAVSM